MNVPMNSCGNLTATIRITGTKRWAVRVWCMVQLIKLAALIAPQNVRVVLTNDEVKDYND